ncbi:tetratricopeptide repeat protein [Psychroflexus sp. CAK57W]|uniref:tetratricopeptide repeat protein n=1 Tax=Psychroflexus curvus TaxID=2873595 RepID=UPI001CCBA3CC|nr:tetratricopeptide repeat protein [Psychroflexus curvus]MBZ9786794.1 tetratricopeptide repeat protein [Psychroflexus curvus]
MKERKMTTKTIILSVLISLSTAIVAKAQSISNAPKKAKTLLAEASSKDLDFPRSEAKIRQAKAIDKDNSDISYNFGNLYIENNELESARLRLVESIESTEDKSLKHKSYHNLGNVLMEEEQYQMAVDAYKDALRNNPTDEETRYNLAYAKSKLKDEKNDENKDGDDNKDKNKDESEDESKDNKDEGENEDKDKDNKEKDQEDDKGDKNENEEDQKDDKGNKDKQEKEKEGEGGDKEQEQPQNTKGQISPQQIQRLLEAIENQEKDVQEKLNAQKAKGQKSKTGKDW